MQNLYRPNVRAFRMNDVLLFSEVHVSGITDDLCARLRSPSERPLGNASPQVTHVSGKTDDSCARLRPPSERPLGNASPQVTHMSGITDDSCARPRPPGRRRRSQRWI